MFLAILLSMLFLCALFDNHRTDALLIALILFAILIVKLNTSVSDQIIVMRVMSTAALLLLSFTLLIGPWARFFRAFTGLLQQRRHIGVAAFLAALFHFRLVLLVYNIELKTIFNSPQLLLGIIVIYILLIMGITSWNFFQKNGAKSWWNIIHLISILPVVIGFGFLIQSNLLKTWQLGYFSVLILVWLALTPGGLPRLIFGKVNNWRQFHLLSYLAFISLFLHAWLTAINRTAISLQIAFWGLFAFVVGSHIVGRLMVFSNKIKRNKLSKPIN